VLIQMAASDAVVPNSATRILSEAMQREIVEYHALVSNHGFLCDPTSLEGARARGDVIEFLQSR
jgi:hypothetical protein